MQSDDKIQRTFVFLMIFQIMGLAFVGILLSNNVFAQTLHDKTLYELVNQTKQESEKTSQIYVGKLPSAIAVNALFTNTVYVANSFSDSVSVISGENNTKIGEDIIVGDRPTDIAVNERTNTVYVANPDSNSTSVINGSDNTKIGEDISVGELPVDIAVIRHTNTVYVANSFSDSVSVINSSNNTKIGEDIIVGRSPSAIAVIRHTNTVYVANGNSHSVSVIDTAANKVVAGIMLDVWPFNSGNIECDGLISPISQYFYVWSGAECTAKPNGGFEFVSWEENLKNNSTQLITRSNPASTIFEDIADLFHSMVNYLGIDDFFGVSNSVKPEAILNVTKFGTFTANFKELPAPLPAEYWTSLFTVVITALVGSWLTPTIIGWRKAKKQGRKLDYYNQEVRKLYSDDKLDKNEISKLDKNEISKLDKNEISKLDILKNDIAHAYSRGKINNEQYGELMKDISIRYEEIFKKEIDSLNDGKNKNIDESRLYDLRKSIEDAYLKGKMNQQHYANLVNNISMLYQEVFKKEIDSLNTLTNNEDKMRLLNKLHSDIEDAYSKEKITEKHYNLLKENISDYENHH